MPTEKDTYKDLRGGGGGGGSHTVGTLDSAITRSTGEDKVGCPELDLEAINSMLAFYIGI